MPWCRFFIPKIASPSVKPGDPNLNEHVMYAKCVKGHVLKDVNDWLLCENLPSPDSQCWQEGGETLFTLLARKRKETQEQQEALRAQEKALRAHEEVIEQEIEGRPIPLLGNNE